MTYTDQDVLDNMGLVHLIAQRMVVRWRHHLIDYDDLVSDGTIGLMHALERFDPKLGFKFSSYGAKCIWGFMLRGHRKFLKELWNAKHRGDKLFFVSLAAEREDQASESGQGLNDHGLRAKQIIEQVNAAHVLEQVWGSLTDRQKEVTTLMLRDHLSQTEISNRLGVTRQAIHITWKRVETKVKALYEGGTQEAA